MLRRINPTIVDISLLRNGNDVALEVFQSDAGVTWATEAVLIRIGIMLWTIDSFDNTNTTSPIVVAVVVADCIRLSARDWTGSVCLVLPCYEDSNN